MNIETINKAKIKDISIYNGEGVHGFKMMITFENDKVLYFNSLWMHYFDVKELDSSYDFEKLDIDVGAIESIYCFEGVGFYIILSTGYIIHLYEEVFDFKEPDYRYNFKVISNRDKELYNQTLNDIIEMEESDDVIVGPPKFW